MKYKLKIKIIPDSHEIFVSGSIIDLPKQQKMTFYLNENFYIDKLVE